MPDVSMPEAVVKDRFLYVTWRYRPSGPTLRYTEDLEYRVSVMINYSGTQDAQSRVFPTDGRQIPAADEHATIPGQFDPQDEYTVSLSIYETGLADPTYTTTDFFIRQPNNR